MIKKLFYYCYYRISRGYRSFNDSHYLDSGHIVLFCTFIYITVAIVSPIFYIFNVEFTKKVLIWVAIPFIMLSAWITFFVSEKRKMDLFKRLEKQYKNEAHKKLKGWLVILYIVGTLVFAIVMGIFFSYKPF